MTRFRKMGVMARTHKAAQQIRDRARMQKAAKPEARQSSVEHHHYTPETGHLIVTFRGGRRYRYEGVDQKTADELGAAESKGSFVNSRIAGRFKVTPL